jgi:hypothetical protein
VLGVVVPRRRPRFDLAGAARLSMTTSGRIDLNPVLCGRMGRSSTTSVEGRPT